MQFMVETADKSGSWGSFRTYERAVAFAGYIAADKGIPQDSLIIRAAGHRELVVGGTGEASAR